MAVICGDLAENQMFRNSKTVTQTHMLIEQFRIRSAQRNLPRSYGYYNWDTLYQTLPGLFVNRERICEAGFDCWY